jgi:hypothetical protein
VQKDVDSAQQQLLASEANLFERTRHSTPARARINQSSFPSERALAEAARPPPLQA